MIVDFHIVKNHHSVSLLETKQRRVPHENDLINMYKMVLSIKFMSKFC